MTLERAPRSTVAVIDGLEDEDDVWQLAAREKQCCAFFDFEVTHDDAEVRLDVTAPEGAEEFLDAFYDEFAPERG